MIQHTQELRSIVENRHYEKYVTKKISTIDSTPKSIDLHADVSGEEMDTITSGGNDMFEAREIKTGQRRCIKIKIEVVTDTLFRFRYSFDKDIEDHPTPMLLDVKENFNECTISSTETTSEIETASRRIVITHDPYEVNVLDKNGSVVCRIGGKEKNNFKQWDASNAGFCKANQGEDTLALECFELFPQEAIYGLGEHFGSLNKVGQTIDLYMDDARGVTSPRAYKNIPFFMSTKGYGCFFNHSSLMSFWVGSLSHADLQVAVNDDYLDFFLMCGDMKSMLHQYTSLTGRGEVPPHWSFGFWQSKISYSSAEETLAVAKTMREEKIPCDVIHLDTHWFKRDWCCDLEFSSERFPDPKGFIEALTAMGYKVSLWQLPYIPEGSSYFDELKSIGGFVKNKNGEVYDVKLTFDEETKKKGRIVGCIDFTHPDAVAVFKTRIKKLLDLGVKVIKTDFGEAAPMDGVYHDGTPGHQMHNLYPLLYNQAAHEITKAVHGNGMVWARSAWAGGQRYPIHWGGDNSPEWSNMMPQLRGGLSLGMSGFQFWSQDIGGFLGETGGNLLIRWMQLGIFTSHVRIHGSGDRELYKFSDEVKRICKKFLELRYQLLPYIYEEAEECIQSSLPMSRPMVLEFPEDVTTWNIDTQFMFGSSLMVAPIFSEENQRKVYFPAGKWTNWFSKEVIVGPVWLNVSCAIVEIPLYIRDNRVVKLGPAMEYIQ